MNPVTSLRRLIIDKSNPNLCLISPMSTCHTIPDSSQNNQHPVHKSAILAMYIKYDSAPQNISVTCSSQLLSSLITLVGRVRPAPGKSHAWCTLMELRVTPITTLTVP